MESFRYENLRDLLSLGMKDRSVYLNMSNVIVMTMHMGRELNPVMIRLIFAHRALLSATVVTDADGLLNVRLDFSYPIAVYCVYKSVMIWNSSKHRKEDCVVNLCDFPDRPVIRGYALDTTDYTIRMLLQGESCGNLVTYAMQKASAPAPRPLVPIVQEPRLEIVKPQRVRDRRKVIDRERAPIGPWQWSDEQEDHVKQLWIDLWPASVIARVVCEGEYTMEYQRFINWTIERLLGANAIPVTPRKIMYAADAECVDVVVKWLRCDRAMHALIRAAEIIEERPMEEIGTDKSDGSPFSLSNGPAQGLTLVRAGCVDLEYPCESLVHLDPFCHQQAWELFKCQNHIRGVSNSVVQCMVLLRKGLRSSHTLREMSSSALKTARSIQLRLSILLEVIQKIQETTKEPGLTVHQFCCATRKCQSIVTSELQQVGEFVSAFERISCGVSASADIA